MAVGTILNTAFSLVITLGYNLRKCSLGPIIISMLLQHTHKQKLTKIDGILAAILDLPLFWCQA